MMFAEITISAGIRSLDVLPVRKVMKKIKLIIALMVGGLIYWAVAVALTYDAPIHHSANRRH